MRTLFIHEFGAGTNEWLMPSLIAAFEKARPDARIKRFHGIFAYKRAGGFRVTRLCNLAFMFSLLPFAFLWHRPTLVVVRTAPPLIQLWAAWIGRLFGCRVVCWMMDYHPEIECRFLDRIGMGVIAGLLRRIDSAAMRQFSCIIALDQAMAELCIDRSRCPVIVHPTWGKSAKEFHPIATNLSDGILRLAYVGNLGQAHDLTTLEKLIESVADTKTQVELHVVGCPASGERRFRRLASSEKVIVRRWPHTEYQALGELYNRLQIALGVVLMKEDCKGTLSPSKFSGYIDFGLPILYCGPGGTNSDLVVREFRGGVAVSIDQADEIADSAERLANLPAEIEAFRVGAVKARDHFRAQTPDVLAKKLLETLGDPEGDELSKDTNSQVSA